MTNLYKSKKKAMMPKVTVPGIQIESSPEDAAWRNVLTDWNKTRFNWEQLITELTRVIDDDQLERLIAAIDPSIIDGLKRRKGLKTWRTKTPAHYLHDLLLQQGIRPSFKIIEANNRVHHERPPFKTPSPLTSPAQPVSFRTSPSKTDICSSQSISPTTLHFDGSSKVAPDEARLVLKAGKVSSPKDDPSISKLDSFEQRKSTKKAPKKSSRKHPKMTLNKTDLTPIPTVLQPISSQPSAPPPPPPQRQQQAPLPEVPLFHIDAEYPWRISLVGREAYNRAQYIAGSSGNGRTRISLAHCSEDIFQELWDYWSSGQSLSDTEDHVYNLLGSGHITLHYQKTFHASDVEQLSALTIGDGFCWLRVQSQLRQQYHLGRSGVTREQSYLELIEDLRKHGPTVAAAYRNLNKPLTFDYEFMLERLTLRQGLPPSHWQPEDIAHCWPAEYSSTFFLESSSKIYTAQHSTCLPFKGGFFSLKDLRCIAREQNYYVLRSSHFHLLPTRDPTDESADLEEAVRDWVRNLCGLFAQPIDNDERQYSDSPVSPPPSQPGRDAQSEGQQIQAAVHPIYMELYFDGSTPNNQSGPGPSGSGSAVYKLEEGRRTCLWEDSYPLPEPSSNNQAEYTGLIRGLEYCKAQGYQHLHIFGDSTLVVNQISRKWRINSSHLKDLANQSWALLEGVTYDIIHLSRNQNGHANDLATRASKVAAGFLRTTTTTNSTRSRRQTLLTIDHSTPSEAHASVTPIMPHSSTRSLLATQDGGPSSSSQSSLHSDTSEDSINADFLKSLRNITGQCRDGTTAVRMIVNDVQTFRRFKEAARMTFGKDMIRALIIKGDAILQYGKVIANPINRSLQHLTADDGLSCLRAHVQLERRANAKDHQVVDVLPLATEQEAVSLLEAIQPHRPNKLTKTVLHDLERGLTASIRHQCDASQKRAVQNMTQHFTPESWNKKWWKHETPRSLFSLDKADTDGTIAWFTYSTVATFSNAQIRHSTVPFPHPKITKRHIDQIAAEGNFYLHKNGWYYLLPWRSALHETACIKEAINDLVDKLFEAYASYATRLNMTSIVPPASAVEGSNDIGVLSNGSNRVQVDKIDWADIGEVCLHTYPTTARTPTGPLLHDFKAALTVQIQRCLTHYHGNREQELLLSLKRLFLLPRALLHIGPRSKHNRAFSITEKVDDIMKDDWTRIDIWLSKREGGSSPTETGNIKRAKMMLSKAQISRAFKALEQGERVQLSADILQQLREMHPDITGNALEALPFPKGIKIELDELEVREAFSSIPRGSNPGLSGLRAEYLKAMAGRKEDDSNKPFLKALTSFMELVVGGLLPRQWYAAIRDSELIAIPKKNDHKVRPIVMADTWAKIASKVALRRASSDILKTFQPLQLGLNTKYGIEIITHSLKSLDLDPACQSFDEIQIDFTNAFNKASRIEALLRLHQKFPQIYPYAYMMYASSSKLLIRDGLRHHIILSKEGARQGDALGTLLFCLTEQDILETIDSILKGKVKYDLHTDQLAEIDLESTAGNVLTLAYVDNISIKGPRDRLCDVLSYLLKRGPKVGLELNPRKTIIRLGHHAQSESDHPIKSYSDVLGRPAEELNFVASHHTNLDIDLIGTENLGTPVGSDAFIHDWLRRKVLELQEDVKKIQCLKHKQSEWILIYYVLRSKVNYLFRALHPDVTKEFAQDIDNLLKSAVEDTIGNTLSREAWDRARLPITKGGLGVGFPSYQSLHAYLASACDCYDFMEQHTHISAPWLQRVTATLQECIAATSVLANGQDILNADFKAWRQLFLRAHPGRVQHSLQDAFHLDKHEQLLDAIKSNSRNSRHYQQFLSASHRLAGKFLLSLPTNERSSISNQDFERMCALRLRLPVVPPSKRREKEDNVYFDPFGDKHLTWDNYKGGWDNRHNLLVQDIFDMSIQAGLNIQKEPALLFSDGRRPDLLIVGSPIHGQSDVLLDLSVCHPIDGSKTSPNQCTQGEKATKRAREKIRKYRADAALQNRLFIPLVVESSGLVHEDFADFIKKLAARIADRTNSLYSHLVHYWSIRISTTLQKSNVKILTIQEERLQGISHRAPDEDERALLYETHIPVLSYRLE